MSPGAGSLTLWTILDFSYYLYVRIPSHSGSFFYKLIQAAETEGSGETYVH
jgi:hypothetical protein